MSLFCADRLESALKALESTCTLPYTVFANFFLTRWQKNLVANNCVIFSSVENSTKQKAENY